MPTVLDRIPLNKQVREQNAASEKLKTDKPDVVAPALPSSTSKDASAATNPVLTATKQDVSMLGFYAREYPFLSGNLSSPDKLMQFIDTIYKRESTNSPGTPADLWVAQKAKSALADIYGINDYTPKGFQKWSAEQKQHYDPRRSSGGDSEKVPQ